MIKLVITVAGLSLIGWFLFAQLSAMSPKQSPDPTAATVREQVQAPTDNITRARVKAKQIEVETQQRADGLMRKTE